jgi:catalase
MWTSRVRAQHGNGLLADLWKAIRSSENTKKKWHMAFQIIKEEEDEKLEEVNDPTDLSIFFKYY